MSQSFAYYGFVLLSWCMVWANAPNRNKINHLVHQLVPSNLHQDSCSDKRMSPQISYASAKCFLFSLPCQMEPSLHSSHCIPSSSQWRPWRLRHYPMISFQVFDHLPCGFGGSCSERLTSCTLSDGWCPCHRVVQPQWRGAARVSG